MTTEKLVVCDACEELRPVTAFYKSSTGGKTHRARSCKRCQLEKSRVYKLAVKARRGMAAYKHPGRKTPGGMTGIERRAYWATFKARRGCVDCGTTDWHVLEFDHLPEFEKLFNISEAIKRTGVYSDEEIAAEVAKCEVVCRPCHQVRTVSRRLGANQGTIHDNGETT